MTRSDHVCSATPDGVAIRFRLTPKSARDRVSAIVETPSGPAVQAHVRAVPANGAANAALIDLSAKWLGVPKSSIAITAGAKMRVKLLKIAGESSALARLVAERIAEIET